MDRFSGIRQRGPPAVEGAAFFRQTIVRGTFLRISPKPLFFFVNRQLLPNSLTLITSNVRYDRQYLIDRIRVQFRLCVVLRHSLTKLCRVSSRIVVRKAN